MRVVIALAALLLVTAAPVLAAPEDVANEISAEIMSPFCDGVTLHDCPSQAALDLRDQIREWSADGWSKARIMAELEERYGPGIHATPQDTEGVGAWALPAGALVLGIALLAWLAPRWTRRSEREETAPIDADEHARIERELATLRREMP